MSKKKILAWCDSPTVPTGFGIVAKNLLSELHKDYDLEIVGINYHGDEKYDTNKWFIYPAATNYEVMGFEKLKRILPKTKPDILFIFQDIFNISEAWKIFEELAPQAKKIIYFPVDGTPFNIAWDGPIRKADTVITYTNFAKQAILDTFPDITNPIHTLDHGIDTNVFKPLPQDQIRNLRKGMGWDGKFLIINVNRFQPRKLIPLTLRAVAMFSKGYKICKCGNWYEKSKPRCDLNNCPSGDVVSEVDGRPNVQLYLHMVPREQGMGPGRANLLQAHAYNAGYRDKDLEKGKDRTLQINAVDIYRNPYPETILNQIYNAACINITTTVGEGFGFSLGEAAATGTISIAPDHSAVPEVMGNTGHLIPNIAHFNMSMDNGHVRPIVDVREVIKALEIEYKKWLDNNKQPVFSQEAVDRVHEKFNWKDKRKFIKSIFDKASKEQDREREAVKSA